MNETTIVKDYEAYGRILDLWKSENPIKTTKLQVLLAVNGALLSVVNFNGGLIAKNLPIFYGGAILCLIWTLSIGRTSLYQKYWQIKLKELAKKYPDDVRFQILEVRDVSALAPNWLKVIGSVSSKYYLLAAPIVFAFGWLGAITYVYI